MENRDGEGLPTSLEEVEALILQLYRPGAPEKIAKIQDTLQKLQRSPQGWQLANGLMVHQNEQVRFFAALTFIVKLNTDSKSLSEDDAQALLQTLITWLIRCMVNSEGGLVVKKLCSTLVAYFIQFSTSWVDCVKHIMYCMCVNEALPYDQLSAAPESSILVQNISNERAVAVFWFASTLVDEVGKMDSNNMKQYNFHRLVKPNVEEIAPLISRYISDITADVKVRQEALKCFQSCVSYSHRAFVDSEIILEPLRKLTRPALEECLGNDDLYEITVEIFTDVLANYSKFLHDEDFTLLRQILNSPWAQARYQQLIKGDFDFDCLQFGMFMLSFGDATVQDLTRNSGAESQSQYLSALCGLLGAEGYAVQEDKIYIPALEFWNTFVETMVDEIYSAENEHPPWFKSAQDHVMRVISNCWRKSQFPPGSVYNSWDSVDRTGFKDARRDFSDLLQQFYLTTGISLLQIFISLMQASTTTKNWAEIEASTYCLSWFADCITDDEQQDTYLDQIFTPSFVALFMDPHKEVPTRAMKGFLDLVSVYADYFGRRHSQLPSVLNIVFEATSATALAKTASKSITKLCSDCREILKPELVAFLQHYNNIASNYALDAAVKEAVMEGIASIIQAIDSDEAKVTPLDTLLNYVEGDIERCLNLITSPQPHIITGANGARKEITPLDFGILATKCLAGIAKGVQVPDDKPVDLESKKTASPFWTTGEGSRVQQRIYTMMSRLYDLLGMSGDIIDEICRVWRHGFREMEPGPFVMPPEVAAQFFMRANLQTPRLVRVIDTSCSLIATNKWGAGLEQVLESLLSWLAQLLQALGEPSNDPEIAQAGIEFLQRLIGKFPKILLNHQPVASLEFLFMFALGALGGTDPLPKAAAAEFWATLIGLSDQPQDIQAQLDGAIQAIGPHLAQKLIFNIGGHAARSELDKLCDPLKKLVVRQLNSKAWFEAALLDPSFPSDKIEVKDKENFLQKVTYLRGARGTNQVVRDFWLLCRGSNFAYAS
ncbi:related to KAP122 Member of the karyopherin-beta family, nuclear import [Phialocephala subalpina]|uniref:Related to KAP122 Member of the karyopherin-beta family, nuclear import n=1 Tax=Phialocephala subalpina TaxID=576137 RepID=A0A1L7X2N8_9HELO|nr:related to KAP122 Member of the karyopherin-beta family, nuclear import [Phialocephala subalpina]